MEKLSSPCDIITTKEVDVINHNRRIQVNNILITILICVVVFAVLFTTITTVYSNPFISQTQTVTVNSPPVDKVNINTASKEALESLPGIGPKLADQIIKERPFKDVHELKRIKGIGDGIIEQLKEVVICQ